MEPAIQTHNLVRVFHPRRMRGVPDRAPLVALDGVTLDVEFGSLFGLLGPNGAGKTTLIKVLTTLLLPTSGSARVGGFDVEREAHDIRERIAVVSGGETSGYGLLTVREQLWMFGRFYGIPSRVAKRRVDELLELVGLADVKHRKVGNLSTGMRQKLNLARGFLADPWILFLDEPTVGLDVAAARDIRSAIDDWIHAKPGRTILLTTHYLHEADELCDRVAIIHRGTILADDTPEAMRKRAAGGSAFVLTTDAGSAPRLDDIAGVRRADARTLNGHIELHLQLDSDRAISDVIRALADQHRPVLTLAKLEPSLEDVFIDIVGRRIEDADE
ncbi:MAG: ABC transporter ATP-binding protein [Actinobacteria bacterium]|nr:ABC transporter ATP-binding protein [Actinomycetota bacterium]